MKGLVLVLFAGILFAQDNPASVVVVVNDSCPSGTGTGGIGASQYVANHYIAARGIPGGNVVHITSQFVNGDVDPASGNNFGINFADFTSEILNPIQTFLVSNGLKYSIKYIVTTYGVPSHIARSDNAPGSVDSYLANMFGGGAVQQPNPYAAPSASFLMPNLRTLTGLSIYAVGRLDGPTPLIAAALVDKAMAAEAGIHVDSGTGYFDWQGLGINPPLSTPPNLSMKAGYDLCVARGLKCALNDQSSTGHLINSAPSALWAWGWYSGNTVNDVYSFVPGAVGAQFTSYTASNIRVVTTGIGIGNWVALWLQDGITATWGVTGEPSYDYPYGDVLFDHLWMHGKYNFGESCLMSQASVNWKGVCIGDPLYRVTMYGPSAARGGTKDRGNTKTR
jgi:uncharacterized protein (TIGR03790 family)